MARASLWLASGALVLGIALSGCNSAKKDDKNATAAGGELLPRSASDDMLPYDTVTSQPDLLDPEAATRSAASHAQVEQDAQDEADAPDEDDAPGQDQGDDDATTTETTVPAAPAPSTTGGSNIKGAVPLDLLYPALPHTRSA
ncbi:hypothetical protein [Novosphingobium sp. 9]|uniref:hypothetical protein n=1 Tax=Novosphingobium sp. 9 TaxID=2025349 RepID=UPI0021B5F014|nr:hypothetical protein [Novosphingobium sp. 9]